MSYRTPHFTSMLKVALAAAAVAIIASCLLSRERLLSGRSVGEWLEICMYLKNVSKPEHPYYRIEPLLVTNIVRGNSQFFEDEILRRLARDDQALSGKIDGWFMKTANRLGVAPGRGTPLSEKGLVIPLLEVLGPEAAYLEPKLKELLKNQRQSDLPDDHYIAEALRIISKSKRL